jgi:hypothetical protein
LTPCSSRGLPALFHAGNALGVRPSEVCSPHAASRISRPACPSCHCPETGLAFRGLSRAGIRTTDRQALPLPVEPILSWVFTSLGCSPFLPRPCHIAWPPLSHFPTTGVATTGVVMPQSVDAQEDWLVSRETADPSEVSVLIRFAAPISVAGGRRGCFSAA